MSLPVRQVTGRPVSIAAHVSPIYGPVQALVNYLKEQGADFRFVSLPFSYAGMPGALYERFEKGKCVETVRGHASRGPEPFLWIKDFFFTLWRGRKAGKCGLFIGIDNLNAAAGIVLKRLGLADRVVYYVIDYTTQRFKNPLFNWIYHVVDRFCVRHADAVWNLSARMQEVRRKQGLPEERNRLVPVGVALEEVRFPKAGKVQRKKLLYMGALQESKGIQLLIEAMPEILKKNPSAELHIIGYGPYEGEIKRLASRSPARASIFVPGGMGHAELFKKVPSYGIALAPYLEEQGSYTYWSDPTKPKEYLACGLPLIITKVPWIWEAVANPQKPMGVAISYNRQELVQACHKLLGNAAFYRRCRNNALAFASRLSWKKIYDQAFSELSA